MSGGDGRGGHSGARQREGSSRFADLDSYTPGTPTMEGRPRRRGGLFRRVMAMFLALVSVGFGIGMLVEPHALEGEAYNPDPEDRSRFLELIWSRPGSAVMFLLAVGWFYRAWANKQPMPALVRALRTRVPDRVRARWARRRETLGDLAGSDERSRSRRALGELVRPSGGASESADAGAAGEAAPGDGHGAADQGRGREGSRRPSRQAALGIGLAVVGAGLWMLVLPDHAPGVVEEPPPDLEHALERLYQWAWSRPSGVVCIAVGLLVVYEAARNRSLVRMLGRRVGLSGSAGRENAASGGGSSGDGGRPW